jgi:hypothetical protein
MRGLDAVRGFIGFLVWNRMSSIDFEIVYETRSLYSGTLGLQPGPFPECNLGGGIHKASFQALIPF